MPKCRFCNKDITKFDSDICPHCGSAHPIDEYYEQTSDITQVIDTIETNTDTKFVQHSKKVNSLLLIFLGIFGADSFYLGFIKYGLIRVLINLIFIGGLFSIFYFLEIFSIYPILLSILVPVGFLFVIYVIIGLFTLGIRNKKDSNGVLLK